MSNFHPGQIVTFETRSNDLMNLNGAKCRIVEAYDDGRYLVEFFDVKLNAFSDELRDND